MKQKIRCIRAYLCSTLLLLFSVCGLLSGCQCEQTAVDKIRDLDFTVVEDINVPEELKDIIKEKQHIPFKLSYSNSQYLFIVVGYGEQPTGGYSIVVDELYETENAIYIDTNLMGPAKGEALNKATTYPYVVVKVEFLDKNVVFD